MRAHGQKYMWISVARGRKTETVGLWIECQTERLTE